MITKYFILLCRVTRAFQDSQGKRWHCMKIGFVPLNRWCLFIYFHFILQGAAGDPGSKGIPGPRGNLGQRVKTGWYNCNSCLTIHLLNREFRFGSWWSVWMCHLKEVSLLQKGVAGNPGSPGQKGEVGYPGPYVSNLHFFSTYEGMDAPNRIILISTYYMSSHHFLRVRKDQEDQGLWYVLQLLLLD